MASLSRRTLLEAAAGAAGCALVGRTCMAAADVKPGGFLLSIQSYTLRNYDFAKALQHVHEFGLHGIEFFGGHFSHESSPEQIDAMKKRCADLDIKILGHGVNGFGKDHEANRTFFEFAKRAGIRNLSADPSEDAFDSLDKLVAEYDIRIAIHNHGPGARYDKIADVLGAVK